MPLGLKLDYSDLLKTLPTNQKNSTNSELAEGNPEIKKEQELSSAPSSSAQAQKPLKIARVRKPKKVSASSDHPKNSSKGLGFFNWHPDINNGQVQDEWIGRSMTIGNKKIPKGRIKTRCNIENDSEMKLKNTKGPSM